MRDIISEKTSCFIHRYVHKKMKGPQFAFNAFNPYEDSPIIYLDRWNQWSSWALDILSDLIYSKTYIIGFDKYVTSRKDERVIEACSYMNENIYKKVCDRDLPFIYKLVVDDSELVTSYPFIFEEMKSSQIERFFRFAEIEFKAKYRVLIDDTQYLYKMSGYDRLFNLSIKSLSSGSGKRIRNRLYTFEFNTPIGFFFVHNIKAMNIHWIDKKLYQCKHPASNFVYKRFYKCRTKRERRTEKTVTFNNMMKYLNYTCESNKRAARTLIIEKIMEDLTKLIPKKNHRGRTEISSISYHF